MIESTPGDFMKRLVVSVKDLKLPLLAKPIPENPKILKR